MHKRKRAGMKDIGTLNLNSTFFVPLARYPPVKNKNFFKKFYKKRPKKRKKEQKIITISYFFTVIPLELMVELDYKIKDVFCITILRESDCF